MRFWERKKPNIELYPNNALRARIRSKLILREGSVVITTQHVLSGRIPLYLSTKDAKQSGVLIKANIGKHIVYKDSLGYPTVGYGHLVKPADGLKFMDVITQRQAEEFLDYDMNAKIDGALEDKKAIEDAKGICISDDLFVMLVSVNYQLGVNWTGKFPNTWANLLAGNYARVNKSLKASRWAKQTPVRVADFIGAINAEFVA